jgi:hypothetical protein
MGQFEMPNSPSASCRPDDVILKGWFLMGWECPNGMKPIEHICPKLIGFTWFNYFD